MRQNFWTWLYIGCLNNTQAWHSAAREEVPSLRARHNHKLFCRTAILPNFFKWLKSRQVDGVERFIERCFVHNLSMKQFCLSLARFNCRVYKCHLTDTQLISSSCLRSTSETDSWDLSQPFSWRNHRRRTWEPLWTKWNSHNLSLKADVCIENWPSRAG